MEVFARRVHVFQRLTTFEKLSIVDICMGPECASAVNISSLQEAGCGKDLCKHFKICGKTTLMESRFYWKSCSEEQKQPPEHRGLEAATGSIL